MSKFDERRLGELWMMRCAGVTVVDCAHYFGIKRASCLRWMAIARRRFGRNETLARRQSFSRAHLSKVRP